jgi:hypothetical protein
LSGLVKQEKSPTAATMEMAAIASMPGMVISKLAEAGDNGSRKRGAGFKAGAWPGVQRTSSVASRTRLAHGGVSHQR